MNPRQTLDLLRDYESRNVTFCEADGSWPIVWERAKGVHVWDAAGKKYLDLTAAFGVAAAGHANANIVRAGQRQMAKLLHAMGDVHPHALKAQLARELSHITFERWTRGKQRGKVLFGCSGFEAVEGALKTAMLATGKRGVIAFEGAYHGVGYGALNTTHREYFRSPFRAQLREFGHFLPFPVAADVRRRNRDSEDLCLLASAATKIFQRKKIGAMLVEPIQGRGGCRVPPPGFLPMLRKLCDRHGALLIVDEVFTGFGRTGKWFACEHSGVVPDVVCLGKALTGGFPLSACVGRGKVMDAWPASEGEAIHTSTFLGHPVGCAMALAQIAEVQQGRLCERSARMGERLRELLISVVNGPGRSGDRYSEGKSARTNSGYEVAVRGQGLMAGLELRHADGSPATREVLAIIKAMLHRGFILLPEGEHANVISFSPSLTITRTQLAQTVRALAVELRRFA